MSAAGTSTVVIRLFIDENMLHDAHGVVGISSADIMFKFEHAHAQGVSVVWR